MGSYKGNTEVVNKNAANIADRLRHTDITIKKLMKEYHISYYCLMRAIHLQMSLYEWKKVRRRILARGGIKTRFKKGVVSFRPPKGVHYSAKTEFKKGYLPYNHKQVGTVVVKKDKCGKWFRHIKVSGIMQGVHKWIPYARYIWEQQNGLVPEGFFVGHKDGKTLNDKLSNLHLVDRKKHLAEMKKHNPGWKKKAIKNRIKTCAKKRKQKQIILNIQAQMKRQQAKQKRMDEADARKINEFFGKNTETVIVWQCTGCGQNHKKMPGICHKCNGLHFEKIEIPKTDAA